MDGDDRVDKLTLSHVNPKAHSKSSLPNHWTTTIHNTLAEPYVPLSYKSTKQEKELEAQ